jgi:iron-sulfur cluster assembly protein
MTQTETRAILTVTQSAQEKLKYLLEKREKPCIGVRVSVRSRGCSGLQYMVEYATEKNEGEEEVKVDSTSIFIDPKALMFLLGAEMDYVETETQAGFIFKNPNEKGLCGCGKSFHV